MLTLGLCCFFILIISAISSGTEAALFSISVSKLKSLNIEQRGVQATLKIKENIESSIRTIVIVNNITNIIGSMFVGYLAEHQRDHFAASVHFNAEEHRVDRQPIRFQFLQLALNKIAIA